MSHILKHFSLQSSNWSPVVMLAVGFVWLVVLGCSISSIRTQPFDRKQQLFWILLVVALPVLGVLAYLPFAFQKEDLPHMFLRDSKKHRRSKSSERSEKP